jgi:hypothetical protein
MEWLLLIVMVPLIVVTIVLLFGFAGCGELITEEPSYDTPPEVPPAAPTNLRVITIGETSITLAWDHLSPATVDFVITRTGPEMVPNTNYATVGQGIGTSFTDGMLVPGSVVPGTTYSYSVRSRNLMSSTSSGASNTVSVRTLKWEAAYEQPLTIDDGATLAGNCLVQRIDRGTYLPFGGTSVQQVRLTLSGSQAGPGASTLIDLVTISHATVGPLPGNPMPDPYDSEADPVSVGGAMLPVAGTPVTLGPIAFALDRNKDLIVAFDINAANANLARGRPNVGTSQAYNRVNAADAAETNRTSVGYQPRPSGVYFVERIEVLTA